MTTTEPSTSAADVALEVAQQSLTAEHHAADVLGLDHDQRAALSASIDIVDHVRRIHLPTASTHYRADKSMPVVAGALRLQTATLTSYGLTTAVAEGVIDEERLDDLLGTVAEHLEAAVTASAAVRWDLARCGSPSETSAHALRTAAGNLTRLATELARAAHPDPEG